MNINDSTITSNEVSLETLTYSSVGEHTIEERMNAPMDDFLPVEERPEINPLYKKFELCGRCVIGGGVGISILGGILVIDSSTRLYSRTQSLVGYFLLYCGVVFIITGGCIVLCNRYDTLREERTPLIER